MLLVALFAVPVPALVAAAAANARWRSLLVRGSIETFSVLGAAVLSAAALPLQAALLPDALVLAPALAAAPWVAGEILSGPSAFRVEALFGAVAAAQALSVVSPLAGALAAAAAYLTVRGPAILQVYES